MLVKVPSRFGLWFCGVPLHANYGISDKAATVQTFATASGEETFSEDNYKASGTDEYDMKAVLNGRLTEVQRPLVPT